MPTVRTLLRHFVKPLLAKHPDIVQKGICLYLRPVHHVARVILIDRTGGSSRVIRWGVSSLLSFRGGMQFQYGGPLYRGGLWYLDDPTAAALFLVEAESKALPSLRALDTLERFHTFATYGFEEWSWPTEIRSSLRFYGTIHASVLAALGRFAEAREVCRDLPQDRWFKDPDFRPEFDRVLNDLYPLLIAEDRPALARLLRSWEEFTIRANKLEDIWEPTPFPFET